MPAKAPRARILSPLPARAELPQRGVAARCGGSAGCKQLIYRHLLSSGQLTNVIFADCRPLPAAGYAATLYSQPTSAGLPPLAAAAAGAASPDCRGFLAATQPVISVV